MFAQVIDDDRLTTPVPSCPGWSLADLVVHLGTVHRWAEHLVRTLAPRRVSSSTMDLGEPDPSAPWVLAGGQALVSTLRAVDPDAPMWAWGKDQHVRFWSRRQLHETLVHRMDAELALGRAPAASPATAADAVDEFLGNVAPSAAFSPKVKKLRGDGGRLLLRATDEDREWTVTFVDDGFQVGPGTEIDQASAVVEGAAVPLLLVLYGRMPALPPAVSVSGDAALVDFWLANSALE